MVSLINFSNPGWLGRRWLRANSGGVQRRPIHPWKLTWPWFSHLLDLQWDEVQYQVRLWGKTLYMIHDLYPGTGTMMHMTVSIVEHIKVQDGGTAAVVKPFWQGCIPRPRVEWRMINTFSMFVVAIEATQETVGRKPRCYCCRNRLIKTIFPCCETRAECATKVRETILQCITFSASTSKHHQQCISTCISVFDIWEYHFW